MDKVSGGLAPALPFSSIFRFQKAARDDILGFITSWAELGGIARFESRLFAAYLVTAPEAVQHILQDNNKNYRKEVRSAAVLRIVMGDALFLSEGDKWRTQRKVVQPAFHRQQLAGMTASMADALDSMLERWEMFATRGDAFDLSAETSRLALDVVGHTLLVDDLRAEAETLGQVLVDLFNYLNYALNHFLVVPRFIPTARNRALSRALRELDRLLYGVIDRRQAESSGDNTGDLLAMLLEAYGGDTAKRVELRDNLGTLLGAGTETTAVALSWAWYLLAKNPEAERALHREVDSVLGARRPTFDDLARLAYTRMVINETLRLYPPAPAISRTAIGDDEVCGFKIRSGSTVLTSQWVTHRNPLYWEEPEKFDPQRFAPERSRDRHDYAYYPFGGGPRMCIGDRFSLMEQTLALAMTAQRFRVRIDHEVVPDPVFTLRPAGGIRARLERASAPPALPRI
ncbi:MAG: cytochrome P450 [Deltaproteobacteria bacterium]|nr:cytochrome P450 [Deltaproteobacteria bacterium]